MPEKYRKTKSGAYLSLVIHNKVALSSKATFPDFSVKDINGNQIELAQLKGRYVLVQFWASWCVPCLKEVPVLKEINDKYRNDPFTLISFSIDRDSLAFQKAVEKYSMTWSQVYGDLRLYNSLANVPIPQLYLVDKNGLTIYNRDLANDPGLRLLKEILAENLK